MSAPLGVFDSGLGGLTVARALLEALPDERILYLGDTARVPYGTRSPETVIRYARSCARVLTDRGVKALVVACNTVSAVALDMLRAEHDLPVIGVIEPGARAAVRAAESLGGPLRIGVLGTTGTIASGAYPRAVAQLSTRLEVVGQPAPLLVPLVEEGWLEGTVPELAVRRYLEPLLTADARVIVLGCTHYPLLKPIIARVAAELCSDPISVVDSAEATAERVGELLAEGRVSKTSCPGSASPAEGRRPQTEQSASPAEGRRPQTEQSASPAEGRLELWVTDQPRGFSEVAARFLGADAPPVQQIDLVAGC